MPAQEALIHPMTTSVITFKQFQKQTGLFMEALGKIEPPVRITVDGCNVRPDNPGNWFSGFSPISWGRKIGSGLGSGFGAGTGVGYGFIYARDIHGNDFMRVAIGLENPLKWEFRDEFRKEVSVAIATQKPPIPPNCRIWPDTKFDNFRFRGTSLLECQPIPLGNNIWIDALYNYSILNKKYNELVAQLLRRYYEQGAFSVELDFDY